MSGCLTRLSSMRQNILETFMQTRQTDGDATSTRTRGKGRPVLHTSPTRVVPYCVPNDAFITSTVRPRMSF
ncbi:hypothetical protein BJX62DRAFT_211339 [Aspergillus germanicus]